MRTTLTFPICDKLTSYFSLTAKYVSIHAFKHVYGEFLLLTINTNKWNILYKADVGHMSRLSWNCSEGFFCPTFYRQSLTHVHC